MINDLLKPIKWFDFDDMHGNKTSTTATIICEYDVETSGGGYEVNYYNRQTEAPSKTATGFKTMEEAKQWAWEHYIEKMTPYLNTDPLTDTVNWFKVAKPEPTNADKTTQIGCNLEEVGEMIEALCGSEWGELITLANACKNAEEDESVGFLSDSNKLELLDALADQIVTAVGVAYMMGFDIIGALREVNESNWSKFENGKAVTDENGKIIKGSDYFKPELDKFVGGSDDD
ncbi:nucleoside triphosphate pyrophosphohydrolase family protein [uncultured Psychrobacter sp.]|uniref:nucleoside triphosphate pyrophosphohydrolase family protein n=1 Tax=uncultured Psychrobacter sp. TaxID=259303 RepID=UPI0025913141|nr:nucleoside triphosphate pyrophosphohydrolase family protein [uncultured Psychrobacter sp.]